MPVAGHRYDPKKRFRKRVISGYLQERTRNFLVAAENWCEHAKDSLNVVSPNRPIAFDARVLLRTRASGRQADMAEVLCSRQIVGCVITLQNSKALLE